MVKPSPTKGMLQSCASAGMVGVMKRPGNVAMQKTVYSWKNAPTKPVPALVRLSKLGIGN